jgi:hypothetical protein
MPAPVEDISFAAGLRITIGWSKQALSAHQTSFNNSSDLPVCSGAAGLNCDNPDAGGVVAGFISGNGISFIPGAGG